MSRARESCALLTLAGLLLVACGEREPTWGPKRQFPLGAPEQVYRAAVGVPLAVRPQVHGGTGGPYVWSIASGTIPPGLEVTQGDPNSMTTLPRFVGTPTLPGRYVLAISITDTASRPMESTTAQLTLEVAVPAPLPVGVWVVRDVDDALSRLRHAYARMSDMERSANEVSLRASLVRFHADGTATVRVDESWVMPGVWESDGPRITVRSIANRRGSELQETHFVIRNDRLLVVSFDTEIELKRSE